MMNPRSASRQCWRGLFVALASAAAAAGVACGDDDPASSPVVANGGTSGTPDAGAPSDTPPESGGTGGTSADPGAGGTTSAGAGGSGSAAGTSGAGGPCTAGEVRECTFDRLCTGTQSCSADGLFGGCECGAAALVGTGVVGTRCVADADCGAGGTCFRADTDSFGGQGGPAGGYCTFGCTIVETEAGQADDCPSHDVQSFCAPIGPDDALFCLRTCLSLEADPGEAKCLNRPDLVCISEATGGVAPFNGMRQNGYCAPLCGSDEECPDGRVCHAQGNLCTVGQYPGNPIGASCDTDGDCSGNACEDRNDEGVGVCTASCVLGSLTGCGYGRDPAERGAACLTPVVAAGRFSEGPGDLGFCRELCDVDEDCEQAEANGWVCTPLAPAAVEFFGRAGACTPG